MNEFIFNDCNVCLNPHKIERTDDKNSIVIWTACAEGKWGFGISCMYNLGGMSHGVWSNSCVFESENQAIMEAIEKIKRYIIRTLTRNCKLFRMVEEILSEQLQPSLF